MTGTAFLDGRLSQGKIPYMMSVAIVTRSFFNIHQHCTRRVSRTPVILRHPLDLFKVAIIARADLTCWLETGQFCQSPSPSRSIFLLKHGKGSTITFS